MKVIKWAALMAVAAILAGCANSPFVSVASPAQRVEALINVVVELHKAEHIGEDTAKLDQKIRIVKAALLPLFEADALEVKFDELIIELRELAVEYIVNEDERTLRRINAIVGMFTVFGYDLSAVAGDLDDIGVDVAIP